MTHIGIQLAGENMMTVSLKVKCHENPLTAVMNRVQVCMHAARREMCGVHQDTSGCTDGHMQGSDRSAN